MTDKVRVYEIAEEAGASSQDVILKAKELGIDLKSPQSAVSFEDAEEITNYIMIGKSSRIKTIIKSKEESQQKQINEKILIHQKKVKIKAIPRNKVKIVTKNFKRNIDLLKLDNEINNNEIEEIIHPEEKVEIQKKKIISDINNISDNEKKEFILNSYPNVTIEINNLKSIKYLKWDLHKEKGVYCIIGENGSGKSSLLISISKLVNRNIFHHELVGLGHYEKTKITYTINDKKMNWIKNNTTNNNWRQDESDLYVMPKIKGFFESSILSGTRFTKIDYYIKNKLTFKKDEDLIEEANEFIINEMNHILYGEQEHFFKFNDLNKIKAKRKANNKLKDIEYEYYALKINSDEILKEQLFSTGEYFLLQLLKFLVNFTKEINIVPPLIIIDEIEISLHPLAQERLIKRLNKLCEEYNLIAIFASHSLHIVDNINVKNRYYLSKNENNDIEIENNISMGYLTSRLYRHQFYDYIILVEDIMAQQYVNLSLNELLKDHNIKYQILPIGPANSVLELARTNHLKKYFGEANIIPIVDDDKKNLLNEYQYKTLNGMSIPIEKYVEAYIYPIFSENNTILRDKLSKFINKNYFPSTLDSLKYVWDGKQNEKNTYTDICYKLAEQSKPKSEEKCKDLANDIKLKLVKFVYENNKESIVHKKFENRLKRFFKISN